MDKDERVVLILGDIGVHGFRDVFKKHPTRCYNIGILEQSTMSLAAGLSMAGLIPIIHSIAPFIVERCYEQIKDDFGYQGLGGNIVSVGASYDYASLGCTHHCPADVALLSNIPGLEINIPGTAKEFDLMFKQSYDNGKIKYFRLSERQNKSHLDREFIYGSDIFLKSGTLGTVVVTGNHLDKTLLAVKDLDVNLIYRNQHKSFDLGGKVFYIEPFYSENPGIHVPKQFLKNYGTLAQHDEALGFTTENIRKQVKAYFNVV